MKSFGPRQSTQGHEDQEKAPSSHGDDEVWWVEKSKSRDASLNIQEQEINISESLKLRSEVVNAQGICLQKSIYRDPDLLAVANSCQVRSRHILFFLVYTYCYEGSYSLSQE
jgi:hypothetical protein